MSTYNNILPVRGVVTPGSALADFHERCGTTNFTPGDDILHAAANTWFASEDPRDRMSVCSAVLGGLAFGESYNGAPVDLVGAPVDLVDVTRDPHCTFNDAIPALARIAEQISKTLDLSQNIS